MFTRSSAGGPLDVMVVGGGQAGLGVGHYLRRAGLSFAICDAEDGPGEARWPGWDSLRAFSAPLQLLAGPLTPGDME